MIYFNQSVSLKSERLIASSFNIRRSKTPLGNRLGLVQDWPVAKRYVYRSERVQIKKIRDYSLLNDALIKLVSKCLFVVGVVDISLLFCLHFPLSKLYSILRKVAVTLSNVLCCAYNERQRSLLSSY